MGTVGCIAPMPGGDLKYAKAEIMTPFGKALSEWKVENEIFSIAVEVPVSTTCELIMPDGGKEELASGKYTFSCGLKKERGKENDDYR